MRYFKPFIRLLALLAVLSACTYKPSESYISPVKPPETPAIELFIDDPTTPGPYLIESKTSFNVGFRKVANPIVSAEVFIDQASIQSGISYGRVLFDIFPNSAANGTHTIQIKVIIKSNNGSLADQLNQELFLLEGTFDIVIDNVLPPLNGPLQAVVENGYMKLKWKLNTSSTRNYSYQLVKNSLTFASVSETRSFKAGAQVSLIDSGYVGTHTNYSLVIQNSFGSLLLGTVDVIRNPTRFTLQSAGTNSMMNLTWTTPLVDAQVMISGLNGARTAKITDGILALDTLFLGRKSYEIFILRAGYPQRKFDSTITITSSGKFHTFTDLKVIPGISKVLILSPEGNVIRLNLTDFHREDSLSRHPPFFSSSWNKIQVGNNGAIVARTSPPYLYFYPDPLTLGQEQSFLPQHFPGFTDILNYTEPSNNGLIGMNVSTNYSLPRAAIGNLNSNLYDDFVWTDSINSDIPLVSEDGQYFSVNSSDQSKGNVYKNISGTWTLIGHVPPEKKYFRNHSTNELITAGTAIRIFNLTGPTDGNGFFQPVRTFNYAAVSGSSPIASVGYDNPADKIYVETINASNYSTIKTYDAVSFTLSEKVTAWLTPIVGSSLSPGKHIYSNHYHFVSSGYAEKIIP